MQTIKIWTSSIVGFLLGVAITALIVIVHPSQKIVLRNVLPQNVTFKLESIRPSDELIVDSAGKLQRKGNNVLVSWEEDSQTNICSVNEKAFSDLTENQVGQYFQITSDGSKGKVVWK